jgi:hypothetical protein
MFIFCSLLALSPLAYVVGDGIQWAMGGQQHAWKGVLAALILWAILDAIRKQGVRLPGGGAMILSWLVAGGMLLIMLSRFKNHVLLAWVAAGTLQMIIFIILQVVHRKLHERDAQEQEPSVLDAENTVVVTRDTDGAEPGGEPRAQAVTPQITPSGKPALTLGGSTDSLTNADRDR